VTAAGAYGMARRYPAVARGTPRAEGLSPVLVGLAGARLARAVSVDEITKPLRDRLALWAYRPDAVGWQRWLYDLVECPICSGTWLTAGAYAVSRYGKRRGPLNEELVTLAAAMGVHVLATLADRLMFQVGEAAIWQGREAKAEVDGA
jgi:hypothetical protein